MLADHRDLLRLPTSPGSVPQRLCRQARRPTLAEPIDRWGERWCDYYKSVSYNLPGAGAFVWSLCLGFCPGAAWADRPGPPRQSAHGRARDAFSLGLSDRSHPRRVCGRGLAARVGSWTVAARGAERSGRRDQMSTWLARLSTSTAWLSVLESRGRPEAPNWSQHRIPSTNQHPISIGTK